MARVSAPLFSLDASGTVANAIVFSKWRGRQYVRRHARPKNPRSAGQIGIRAAMKFLAQAYTDNKGDIDTNFADPSKSANVSFFNAYVAYNIRRWRQAHGVSIEYPATESANSITITQGLTAGQRNIIVSVTASATTLLWAIAIYRSTATITTVNWNNCIAIIPVTDGAAHLYTDAPLVAGTYHYRAAAINNTGKIGTACADASATSTT